MFISVNILNTNLKSGRPSPEAINTAQITYHPNAIAGQIDSTLAVESELQIIELNNLFGYVCPLSSDSDLTEPIYSLYSVSYLLKDEVIIEKNCKSVSALPKNHGLDPKTWDLNDLSNPKLK